MNIAILNISENYTRPLEVSILSILKSKKIKKNINIIFLNEREFEKIEDSFDLVFSDNELKIFVNRCYDIKLEKLNELSFDSMPNIANEISEVIIDAYKYSSEDVLRIIEKEGLEYALIYYAIRPYECCNLKIGKCIQNIIPLIEKLKFELCKDIQKEFDELDF